MNEKFKLMIFLILAAYFADTLLDLHFILPIMFLFIFGFSLLSLYWEYVD